uniref:Cytochrome b6-f complex subunit 6 n=1 Tax=Cumathamnion serrulatum TaxID=1206573 RepID=A0A7U1G3X9_9FLOR|nr:cytochrome b6-f complex subunit VI [Cumathamnion serrulatum]QQY85429.1 cytochrome b6-f complex subunit VI [Cumathamnion serrulatum]
MLLLISYLIFVILFTGLALGLYFGLQAIKLI